MMSQNASENMTHSRLNRVCSGVLSCVKDLKMIDHVKITGVNKGPEKKKYIYFRKHFKRGVTISVGYDYHPVT